MEKPLKNQAPSKAPRHAKRETLQWLCIFQWPESRTFNDNMNRRKSRTLPGNQRETYDIYDATGNLTHKTSFKGNGISYSYNTNGGADDQLSAETFNEGSISFNYDGFLRRQSMTDVSGTTTYNYDSRDRMVAKNNATYGNITYGYDSHGNLTSSQSGNTNGANVSYQFDAVNRPVTVTDTHRGVNTTTYSYDGIGNMNNMALPNGASVTYQYDQLNRLNSMAATKTGPTTLASYAYMLGAAGNRTNVAEYSGRTVAYSYDDLYRLGTETISSDPVVANNGGITYTYDGVGNRLSRSTTLVAIPTQTFSGAYDTNDRLTATGYNYDNDGNTLSDPAGNSYQYDSLDRLTQATMGTTVINYVYDGDGNRVSKSVKGLTTNYLVDTNNLTGYPQVVDELQGGVVKKVYTYGSSLISMDDLTGTPTMHFYGKDGQGSTRFLMDSTGSITDTYDYDAFGNLINQTHTGTPTNNVYLYDGEQFDPDLGQYYLRARYMNQAIGRFQNMDSYEGEQENPLTLNKYIFVADDPLDQVDPTGFEGEGGGIAGDSGAFNEPLNNVKFSVNAGKPQRILVGLSNKKLFLLKINGSVQFSANIVVGAPDTPTFTGKNFHLGYWEKDKISNRWGVLSQTAWSKSRFGANVFGAYFVPILDSNNKSVNGEGIHGKFGNTTYLEWFYEVIKPHSHGCIRLSNPDISTLHDLLPKSNDTPLEIDDFADPTQNKQQGP